MKQEIYKAALLFVLHIINDRFKGNFSESEHLILNMYAHQYNVVYKGNRICMQNKNSTILQVTLKCSYLVN